ncbi:MAG: SDR family oxidoreductase [Sandaracinaceae bacterium]|nr:SDR family oxidoreductase [Sandaracinaceae bacterium]
MSEPRSEAGAGLLADRVVLVTGAARGIGRAVATLAAREGAKLALLDRGVDLEGEAPDPEVLRTAAAELRAGGATALELFDDDVASPGAVDRVVAATIERFGRLDGIVHAAALSVDASVLRMTPAQVERVLAVQLGAAFALVRAGGQALVDRKEGGSIVLFSGPSAFFGARGHAALGAAQAGVVALVRSAALELRRHRVRVNALCPTARTRATEALPTFAAIDETSMSPAHVASVAVFLLSPLAEEVHGEAIGVAGARTYAIRPRETTGSFGPTKPLDPREVRAAWPEVLKP